MLVKKTFDIVEKMKSVKVEKDVENFYREAFSYYYGTDNIVFSSPYSCDGFLKFKDTKEVDELFIINEGEYDSKGLIRPRILFEFKYDLDFKNKLITSEILLQSIFYLKKFELDGKGGADFPSIIFIGDRNECFFVHTNSVLKYLDKQINWNIAPSEASKKYPNIVLELVEDNTINPFPFDLLNENFQDLLEKISRLNLETKQHIRITEHNISRIFSQFTSGVLLEKNLTPEQNVSIFIGCIIDSEHYYMHPKKKNTLIIPNYSDGIKVNSEKFLSFFSYFQGEKYSITEQKKFTEIQDRLIDEIARRKSGEYFTPTIWADEAVTMISETFGENWKEEYIVWDCSCGTKNLTRDHSFKKIYLSTLYQSDLDVSKKYNKEHLSRTFQYDFLNDDIDLHGSSTLFSKSKLPKELIEDLESNKPILFFINPPYGTANSDGAKGDGSLKKGMSKTNINELMKDENYGYSSQQLYTQFLYRIMKFKETFKISNMALCLFSNTIFLSGMSFINFRKNFFQAFKFETAMTFRANHFADVSDDWGISFSIWSTGETINKEEFLYSVKDIVDIEIQTISQKTIFNVDNSITASEWSQGDFNKKYRGKTIDYPQLSSPINVQQKGRGKFIIGALGFINNLANNIYQSEGGVGIFSSAYSGGNGYPIMPEYFDNIISNFMARRLGFSTETWVNQKDEFLKPNTEHPEYKQWLNDALVFTIFNPKAKVSSLRDIEYKNEKYKIINEFFFMPNEEIKELANNDGNSDIYEDTLNSPNDRFIYLKLKDAKLSKEAKNVYDLATKLTRDSFQYRKILAEEFPQYHLNTWDTGWYQIKFGIDKFMPDEFKKFEALYKILFEKWKPYIYELGFLKK